MEARSSEKRRESGGQKRVKVEVDVALLDWLRSWRRRSDVEMALGKSV